MRSLIAQRLYLLGACLVAFAFSTFLQPSMQGHGLTVSGSQTVDQIAIITSNDRLYNTDASTRIKWVGYLYTPRASEVYFRIPEGVQARLVIGGDVVFDTFVATNTVKQAVAYPAGGFNAIAYEVATQPEIKSYVQAGLEWQSPFGWQLVSPNYLYPQPTTPQAAQQTLQQSLYATLLAWLGVALAAAFIVACIWPLQLSRRTAIGLGLVVLLAFSLRLVFLSNYAAQPTADVLGIGSDNRGYQSNAVEFLRGHWPPASPFYMQPGISLLLGTIYKLFGPSMRVAQLIQFAFGALASILVFDVGRRTFDNWTGWAAAFMWSIFPLPIFYEAQFLTHGLEPVAGIAVLFVWVRSLEKQTSALKDFLWVLAAGLTLGVAALLRPTFLILAPFMALSLFIVRFQQRRQSDDLETHTAGLAASRIRAALLSVVSVVVLTIATTLPISPITWHNYQTGHRFQLLTSNSDVTLYLGNNRDTTGLGEYTPAFYATQVLSNQGKTSYFEQTLIDIRNDPTRWLQLMARKTFLYLGDAELPNNVDFYTEGMGISPLLSTLPLRFGAMMALALAGMLLALRQRSANYYVLLIYFFSNLGVTVAYHVFSRFRAPVYPILAIFGAYAIRSVLATLRQKDWRGLALSVLALAASGAAIGFMPAAAEAIMSKPIVTSIPANATRLDLRLNDTLTLIGHDPLPVVAPGDPFFITLYWSSSAPIDDDLFGTIQLFGGDLKVAQADQMMGTGSFPDYSTRQWLPGQVVKDVYYLRMPEDAPTPLGLNLLVAAYHHESGERVGETTFGSLPLTRHEPLAVPPEAIKVDASVGGAKLNAYTIQNGVLTLYWEAGTPMPEDGVVFVHLFDAEDKFVNGSDSRPRIGLYPTTVWQPGEGIVDEHPLPAAPAGTYTLKIGMYDATTQARLPVVTADGETMEDGVLVLGEVNLK